MLSIPVFRRKTLESLIYFVLDQGPSWSKQKVAAAKQQEYV